MIKSLYARVQHKTSKPRNKRRKYAYIFGTDAPPRLINQALAEQIEAISTGSRKEVPQRSLGELANWDIVG